MSVPRRWLDDGASATPAERELLRSSLSMEPPPGAQGEVWAALLTKLPPPGPLGGGGGGAGGAGHAATAGKVAVAAKAGQVVAGFSKVEAVLKERGSRNTVAALIHAADGASDGIRKLDALLGQRGGQDPAQETLSLGESARIPVITILTSLELDLALTRSNVIHAALLAGPASKTFLSRSQTLVRYRMADADKTAGTGARNSKPHSTSLSRDGDDLQ